MESYDQRVIKDFLSKAWRWDEHTDLNKKALNYIGGFMLIGFTGSISLDLNQGQHSRMIYTPAPIKTKEELEIALMKMMHDIRS